MERSKFFAVARATVFGGRVSKKQVDGTEAILAEAERRAVPLKHLAYILATTYHETAGTMQPIREYGRGKGREYGKPVGPHNQIYYGRGYVQLTWMGNYDKAGKAFGVDLLREPDRALEPSLAAAIMFTGMAEGWFTTHKLSDYINEASTDYRNARRIVNGIDKAALIAGYAVEFQKALSAAGYAAGPPKPPIPRPDDEPDPIAVDTSPKTPKVENVEKARSEGGLIAAVLLALAAFGAWLFSLPCNLFGVLCS